MSLQRKRGQYATVWPSKVVEDQLGNKQEVVDWSRPIKVRAAFIPDRSARAEVPGQLAINVFTMLVRPDLEGVGLWARVKWRDAFWDIVTPPAIRFGSRQVRHWTFSIRERPERRAMEGAS